MGSKTSRIAIIAALGQDTHAIGFENQLLWKLEGDLPRFKKLTGGHPVIMGRHTWLSLGQALPGRTNIVISSAEWLIVPPGVLIARSLEEAIEMARNAPGGDEIFIIGGGRVYAEALAFADRLYLTLVNDDKEGDTHFPAYASLFTKEVEREEHLEHVPPFAFVTLER